jgi:hypothetical protein
MNNYERYKNRYKIEKFIELEYPYLNLYYKLDKQVIKKLKDNYKPTILNDIPEYLNEYASDLIKLDDKYIIIHEKDDEINKELNSITDYYTETCRKLCVFYNRPSPYNHWIRHKKHIIKKVNNTGKLSIKRIREELYNQTGWCSNFKISVALAVLTIFNPKKWLDISAGWGDRLISAIIFDLDCYCGVDPNDCLKDLYKKIIKDLAPNKNFRVIHDGFETADLPDIKFDLVFSSPPFFDVEIYSKSDADSLVRYDSEESWYNNFLIKSIDKSYDYLEKDGHLVLYISEGIKTNYITRMIEHINKKMKYNGVIYYYMEQIKKKPPRKIYVWTKN